MNAKLKYSAQTQLKVRYAETDQMGVVYHPNYFVWFHEARDQLIRNMGIHASEIERDGFTFPFIEAKCQYQDSARYGDDVSVQASIEIGKIARADIDYVVSNARSGRKLAVGHTKSAIVDGTGRMLIETPEFILDAIARSDRQKKTAMINEHASMAN